MDSSIHTTPFVGRQVFFNRVLATGISGSVPYIEHDTLSSVSLTSRRPLHPLPLSGTNRGRNSTKNRSNQTSYTHHGSAILPGVERHSLCDLWCLLVCDTPSCTILLPKTGQPLNFSSIRLMGTALAWRYRQESKSEFLSGNRTRTGQENTLKARLEPTRLKLAVSKHSSFRPNLPTLSLHSIYSMNIG